MYVCVYIYECVGVYIYVYMYIIILMNNIGGLLQIPEKKNQDT